MATTENENMIVTENIELKAPKGDAFYDISYVAENNEILDKEIKKSNEHIDNLENPHKVTAKQVGLGNVPNVATNDQAPTYTEASTLATLTSGEKLSIAFGKIKCAITRLIDHIANTTMHVTANERATWNAKASTDVVSTSANGLCPKRGGTTTKFLRDDGTWAVPPNTTYGTATTSSAGLMSAAMVAKLNGIATGATKNTVDSALSSTSTNPIQNNVVNAALEEINSNLKVYIAKTTITLAPNAYTEVTIPCEGNLIPYAIVGWNTLGADLVITVCYGRSDGYIYAVVRNVGEQSVTREIFINYFAK